jgi:hypothetical protein
MENPDLKHDNSSLYGQQHPRWCSCDACDPNNIGNGHHNPRYDQEYLEIHLEPQALKPMSPYDEVDLNENWHPYCEPDLPLCYGKPAYRPLPHDTSKCWIRVMKLEPGWAYSELRCSLIHINIDDDDHVPYEAISYTWGKYYENIRHDGRSRDQTRQSIICDGQWTCVTRSLSHALKKFRLTSSARILWADALCINQDDEEEKSWQVRLMTQIYSKALHVLIWAGYRDPKVVKRTMDLICKIVNQERSEKERRGTEAKWYNEETMMDIPGTPDYGT